MDTPYFQPTSSTYQPHALGLGLGLMSDPQIPAPLSLSHLVGLFSSEEVMVCSGQNHINKPAPGILKYVVVVQKSKEKVFPIIGYG